MKTLRRFLALVFVLLIGALAASQVVKPSDWHDFESEDFYKTSAAQTDPGDTTLLQNLSFSQALGGELTDFTTLDLHVYPNFLPQIRRYAWYPYRRTDQLTISPTWSGDVAKVTLNGAPVSLSDPILVSAENIGQEVRLEAFTPDDERRASYVVLIMPHNFPPLKTRVNAADDVAPGIITGVQAAPNNPTYSRLKQVRMLL
ncbi:MAG: cadherin-like beta sandwich domain-containing protein, partial [Pseudomonadota bacterium]